MSTSTDTTSPDGLESPKSDKNEERALLVPQARVYRFSATSFQIATVAASFVAVIAFTVLIVRSIYANSSGSPVSELRYDYIVVGAGTAGSIVAAGLAEKSGKSVLLIEEGGYALQNRDIWDASRWLDAFFHT